MAKKTAAQLDREIAEALAGTSSEIDPSQLRVGQRFDHIGHIYEITKIGRDKQRTVQIARRVGDPFGKQVLIDHRSFPASHFDRQHLTPIAGLASDVRVGSYVELPAGSSYREADEDIDFEGDTHGDVVKIKGDAAWVRMNSGRMDWFKLADLKVER